MAYALVKRRYAARRLCSNTCEELACITDISTTSREEEAGSEMLLFQVSPSDSTRNRLFSAGQAVQPKDAALVPPISPVIYLLEEVDTGIGKADRVVLLLVCVKERILGVC